MQTEQRFGQVGDALDCRKLYESRTREAVFRAADIGAELWIYRVQEVFEACGQRDYRTDGARLPPPWRRGGR